MRKSRIECYPPTVALQTRMTTGSVQNGRDVRGDITTRKDLFYTPDLGILRKAARDVCRRSIISEIAVQYNKGLKREVRLIQFSAIPRDGIASDLREGRFSCRVYLVHSWQKVFRRRAF